MKEQENRKSQEVDFKRGMGPKSGDFAGAGDFFANNR